RGCRSTPTACWSRSAARGPTRRGRARESTRRLPSSRQRARARAAASAPWRTWCGLPCRKPMFAQRPRRNAPPCCGQRSCRRRSRRSMSHGPPTSRIARTSRRFSKANDRCSTRAWTTSVPSRSSRRRSATSNAPSARICRRAPQPRFPLHKRVIEMRRTLLMFVVIGLALLAAGAAFMWMRAPRPPAAMPDMPAAASTPAASAQTVTPRGPVTIDPRRQQLIGVRTVAARKTTLTPTVRAAGTVRSAETRLTDVNVKLDGWIRDLFVDYTGQAVTKGQPLFTLYSPDLLAAENEYLLALKARDQLQQSAMADAKDRAAQLVVAARQRL